ncbi:MAG: translin family protein [ANME-2 cluster archaeon]|nr:translin family protein [ANME-2 cluster archaeon]
MLSKISARLFEHFEVKDIAREHALKLSRTVVRLSSSAIKSIHRKQFDQAKDIIVEAGTINTEIKSILADHPELYFAGFVEQAQQEFAEATILYCIINENRIPDTSEIDVEDPAYLMGLGDVVGELRRVILDLIRLDKPTEGEKYLDIMDDIYTTILFFDFPDALLRGLRHKGDVARSLVERTRGELTNAIGHEKLKERMSELEKKLE